ncbi:MAG TPA: DNA polymerase I [Thermoanaerobaculia bacterium]|nr:DNA polymerase I [Thermoanaerobaculia bacterium]
MASRGSLYLIDGSNNLYRSYYAIRGLSNSAGMATNAVYGFTQMLRKLVKDHKPDALAVAFDVGASTFRHEQFEDYKKDRRPMPDDLVPQIPLVYEVCRGFGLPIITREQFEADDLIGSLACKARDAGYEVVIATSDKDFFQMVGPGIRLYHTGRDIIYDESGVTEVFGLSPKSVVDVMGIWGDSIDNIPGVPGIGEKGAKALISQFGSLENLYEHIDEVPKPAQRKKLEEFRAQAFLSRDLATIRCDLDIDVTVDQLTMTPPDRAALHDLFTRMEFTTLLQEFLPQQEQIETHYSLVGTGAGLQEVLDRSREPIAIFVESSTEGGKGELASISPMRGESWVLDLRDGDVRAVLASSLSSSRLFIAHDMKAVMRALALSGLPMPSKYEDTMMLSYVINPGAYGHEIETVSRERLKRDVLTRKEHLKKNKVLDTSVESTGYLGEKSDIALALHEMLSPEVTKDPDLTRIYREIELPLIPVLARMEEKGIRIDLGLLADMSKTMGDQIASLEIRIFKEAGEEFNINSPTQLSTILFDKLQYPSLKKTQKTKSSSTGVEVLKELASYGYAVPKLILEHRELHKLKSTYVDALPVLVDENRRVHTSFNQAVAATGRLSSSDPNLQNIPIRTTQGKEIRRAFIADEGNVLLAADYSQIELRILAHMSGDESLIEAFHRGVDIHRATAAKIFNVHEALVTHEQRRASKTINFGVLYGMSAFRLSQELGISGAEAKEFIVSYFARYPGIRGFLDRTLEGARATGKVTTLFGRVRHIPEIYNRSFTIRSNAERMATNAPIQGTAADLLKLAMIELDRQLRAAALDVVMLLTVHDEIVMEVGSNSVEAAQALVKKTMESVYPLAVPLAVETCWGKSWFEAKE